MLLQAISYLEVPPMGLSIDLHSSLRGSTLLFPGFPPYSVVQFPHAPFHNSTMLWNVRMSLNNLFPPISSAQQKWFPWPLDQFVLLGLLWGRECPNVLCIIKRNVSQGTWYNTTMPNHFTSNISQAATRCLHTTARRMQAADCGYGLAPDQAAPAPRSQWLWNSLLP